MDAGQALVGCARSAECVQSSLTVYSIRKSLTISRAGPVAKTPWP